MTKASSNAEYHFASKPCQMIYHYLPLGPPAATKYLKSQSNRTESQISSCQAASLKICSKTRHIASNHQNAYKFS